MIFKFIDYLLFSSVNWRHIYFLFSFINMYLTQPYQLVSSKLLFLKSNNCFFPFFRLIYLFNCTGSSLLQVGFLQLWRVRATLHCGTQASHWGDFSCCGAQALGRACGASVVVALGLSSCASWAQQLNCMWALPGPGIEPCIGRQILNYQTTREHPSKLLLIPVLQSLHFWMFSLYPIPSFHYLGCFVKSTPVSPLQPKVIWRFHLTFLAILICPVGTLQFSTILFC